MPNKRIYSKLTLRPFEPKKFDDRCFLAKYRIYSALFVSLLGFGIIKQQSVAKTDNLPSLKAKIPKIKKIVDFGFTAKIEQT